jgi:hypothetical protein
LGLAACASTPPPDVPKDGYTLVNLRPDEGQKVLYSLNYQREGFIPRCTPIQIERLTPDELSFTVKQTGVTYSYVKDKFLRRPFEEHINLHFGRSCDVKVVESMSEADQRGIANGMVAEGMTKEGVILALGYPPDHATPSTEMDRWQYWISRFNTIVIEFRNGVVTSIRD